MGSSELLHHLCGVNMILSNAYVYTRDFRFAPDSKIKIEGERIAKVKEGGVDECVTACKCAASDEVVDLQGMMVIPGLVDVHFHGSVGYDLMDGTEEALDAIAKYQAKSGITAICPATMTMAEADIIKACENVRDYKLKDDAADVVGIYMEGPFISPKKVGAQNPAFVHKPDVDFFRRCNKASGNKIKIMAIAPEEPGALEAIKELSGEVLPTIAHTVTAYDVAKKAIANGASHLTHLYNAMPGLAHRDPGPIAAGADAQWCEAEIICDGIHIHPSAVRAAFRMFGEDKMILISDSMMAVGLEDGTYELGGQEVFVKDRRATLASGTIAGSATNLFDCMKIAHQQMGLPLETVVRCASYNPARSIKALKDYGSIEEGKMASLLVIDRDLNLKGVLLRGKWLVKNF